jgi:hypothetical protein
MRTDSVFVMPGLGAGHPRLPFVASKDVDGRDSPAMTARLKSKLAGGAGSIVFGGIRPDFQLALHVHP